MTELDLHFPLSQDSVEGAVVEEAQKVVDAAAEDAALTDRIAEMRSQVDAISDGTIPDALRLRRDFGMPLAEHERKQQELIDQTVHSHRRNIAIGQARLEMAEYNRAINERKDSINREMYKFRLQHGEGYVKLFRNELLSQAEAKVDAALTSKAVEVKDEESTVSSEQSVDEDNSGSTADINEIADERPALGQPTNGSTTTGYKIIKDLQPEETIREVLNTESPAEDPIKDVNSKQPNVDEELEDLFRRIQTITGVGATDELADPAMAQPSKELVLVEKEKKANLFKRIHDAVRQRLFRRNRFLNAIKQSSLNAQNSAYVKMTYDRANHEQSGRLKKVAKVAGALAVTGAAAYFLPHLIDAGNVHHAHSALNEYGTQPAAKGDTIHFYAIPKAHTVQPANDALNQTASKGSQAANTVQDSLGLNVSHLSQELKSVNVNDIYPWTVAHTLDPNNAYALMNHAVSNMNAVHGTHYVLTAHNGTMMYMQGNQVITPHDQKLLNEEILKLAA